MCGVVADLPVYSGKQMVSGDFLIFSSNKSFLLRKSIIDVSVNHLLLQMESNSFNDSCIRFCKERRNVSLPINGHKCLLVYTDSVRQIISRHSLACARQIIHSSIDCCTQACACIPCTMFVAD